MSFFTGLSKLIRRKKSKGYYNSDYIITVKEKQSLIIGFSLLILPFLITAVLISFN